MPDGAGSVLAHPLRHRLLLEYSGEPDTPSAVARRLGRPLNLVSYHTGVLVRHGCLTLLRTERRRGRLTHVYQAAVPTTIDAPEWVRLPARLRRELALGSVAEATQEAVRAAQDGHFDAAYAHVTRLPLELDEPALAEVGRRLRTLADEIAAIAAACPGGTHYEVVLLGFHTGD